MPPQALRKQNRRAQQLLLPLRGLKVGKKAKEHGGEASAQTRGRKTARPFDPGKLLHITMRSSQAVDERSMLHPKRAGIIKRIVYSAAKRQGIIIKRYVCVGNHLHILLQTKARRMTVARPALRAFLREVSGLVARVMTGAQKGRPMGASSESGGPKVRRKFWDHLAWSRIVECLLLPTDFEPICRCTSCREVKKAFPPAPNGYDPWLTVAFSHQVG